jgi:hypothetical protein
MSWVTSLSPSSDQGNKFVAQLALIQYELGNKFVAQLGPGRQNCRPSHAELGLKDWAYVESIFYQKPSAMRFIYYLLLQRGILLICWHG